MSSGDTLEKLEILMATPCMRCNTYTYTEKDKHKDTYKYAGKTKNLFANPVDHMLW